MNISTEQRQRWISVLAKAPTEVLLKLSDSVVSDMQFELIREPEIGLTQVRARMGGKGDAFNMGDMTVTRCVVRSQGDSLGFSYVAGRNKAHALRAAQLDAMLQLSDFHQHLTDNVIEPLKQQASESQQVKQQATAATKVDFFTLVRGED
ncbi:alpha-D-ribose 1-methylphosphonate 5-triphosphate synthase subunit PhnG [Amphritea atlantica]|uniref:Alpha-D-ribose 1-methylphosphonate 5-triphosphate synthase subunit PhnG n=1 Tax=Amphritea atlantica TaxID=355243 RepID=A0A1H9DCA3_9GAMM|nr:phosphonate C-P lyase system protein PhnG [Amphritea atlantica]SEQ11001.1 alpha-D-ribose 1-methylphosphonate 5-triphosphate synthase subunit PhnG [Amphritea atlantica]